MIQSYLPRFVRRTIGLLKLGQPFCGLNMWGAGLIDLFIGTNGILGAGVGVGSDLMGRLWDVDESGAVASLVVRSDGCAAVISVSSVWVVSVMRIGERRDKKYTYQYEEGGRFSRWLCCSWSSLSSPKIRTKSDTTLDRDLDDGSNTSKEMFF